MTAICLMDFSPSGEREFFKLLMDVIKWARGMNEGLIVEARVALLSRFDQASSKVVSKPNGQARSKTVSSR